MPTGAALPGAASVGGPAESGGHNVSFSARLARRVSLLLSREAGGDLEGVNGAEGEPEAGAAHTTHCSSAEDAR
jgi:hypothetical protein